MILKNTKGFTLIEILIYLFITAMLLLAIASLIVNTFNARKQLKASDLLNHNAIFINNYLSNRIHNVDLIDDVSPDPEQIIFYTSTSTRFSIAVENDDFVYRETEYTEGGFPEQSSADPIILNSAEVKASSFVLTAMADNYGTGNKGVNISFTLTIGMATYPYSYIGRDFNTFISIR